MRPVVDHVAEGIEPAGARAGVPALLREAGLVPGAVLVDHTLGVGAGRRTVHHAAQAVYVAG